MCFADRKKKKTMDNRTMITLHTNSSYTLYWNPKPGKKFVDSDCVIMPTENLICSSPILRYIYLSYELYSPMYEL
jgi:hypothetical protein